jgi:hypothetical protein
MWERDRRDYVKKESKKRSRDNPMPIVEVEECMEDIDAVAQSQGSRNQRKRRLGRWKGAEPIIRRMGGTRRYRSCLTHEKIR